MTTVHGFIHSGRYAYLLPTGMVGKGRGNDGTFLEVADHSSASKRYVPSKKGSTNPLYVVRTTGKSNVRLEGLTIDGGTQGHLYNGVRVEKTVKPVLTELRVRAVPGNSDIPPGETFGINLWRTTDAIVTDTEVDGAQIGASGLGFNSCIRGIVTDFTAHDHKWCKAIALWQQKGGATFTRVQSLNNAFGFGFERCEGTYRLDHCKFRGSTRADIHLASDTVRAKVTVADPDLGGKKLKVLLSRTEMGKPNRQTHADLTLTVDGKARPDLIEWVTRA